jgi:hypothetical protein
MKNLTDWAWLAGAALFARDELRLAIPKLNRAIATGDTSTLVEMRDMLVRQSENLREALKHPAQPSRRARHGRRKRGGEGRASRQGKGGVGQPAVVVLFF